MAYSLFKVVRKNGRLQLKDSVLSDHEIMGRPHLGNQNNNQQLEALLG